MHHFAGLMRKDCDFACVTVTDQVQRACFAAREIPGIQLANLSNPTENTTKHDDMPQKGQSCSVMFTAKVLTESTEALYPAPGLLLTVRGWVLR